MEKKKELEITPDELLEDIGNELVVVNPNYVITPADTNEINSLVGEINGFIQSGGAVQMPRNYDHIGALKNLYLSLIQTYENNDDRAKGITLWGKVTATPERKLELMTAAREYVMNGLNVNKGQCYFYLKKGGKYGLDLSYKGYEMLALKNSGVSFRDYVLHDGDSVALVSQDNGEIKAIANINLTNRNKPIMGALAIAINSRGQQDRYLYMDWNELCQARDKGIVGGSPAYKTSREAMYGKLVVKALAKKYYKVTDDSAINRDDDYFVSGNFEKRDYDRDDLEYQQLGKGAVSNISGDSDNESGGTDYWYDNANNAREMEEDMVRVEYLSAKRKNAGEKYDGTYIGYDTATKMAVIRKAKEEVIIVD